MAVRWQRCPAKHLLIVLLLAILTLAACNGGMSQSRLDGYIKLTVENRIASFSCEYRDYYSDTDGPRIVDSTAHRFTYVYILAPQKTMPMPNPEPGGSGQTVDMKYVPAYIDIRVEDASKYQRPAAERIEDHIASWSRWPNFKLLERSTVMVDEIQAELIAYQVDGFFAGPPLKYQANVCFDHDGLQWNIDLEADLDLADVVRADLSHIIETFKVIE